MAAILKSYDHSENSCFYSKVKAVEKFRDVLRGCCVKTAGGITYLVIGIENQSDIHYAMVVRNMLYDALNYSSQVEKCAKQHRENKDVSGAEFLSGFSKEDKLVPVVTLTVYWNTGNWDGARSLHEMFDVSDRSILNYVSDYKLNLIVPEEIEDFDRFKTELGPLLEFINVAANGKKLKNALGKRGAKWETLSEEAIDLLNVCLKTKLKKRYDSEKGAGNMCRGIEELCEMARAEGEAKGKAEGEAKGEARLSSLINILCSKQLFEEVQKVTADKELRNQYYLEYNL